MTRPYPKRIRNEGTEDCLWDCGVGGEKVGREGELPFLLPLSSLGLPMTPGDLNLVRSTVKLGLILKTVVLEKTLESPLGCKEIQPVHLKGH